MNEDRLMLRTLLRILEHLENLERHIMANKADLDASVAALKTALDALVVKAGGASVPDTDLDEVKAAIDAMTAEANAAATPTS